MSWRSWAFVVGGVVVATAAACGGGSGEDVETADLPTTTIDAAAYAAEAAALPAAADDASFPDVDPAGPVGSYGFSHYVWTQVNGAAVPTLIEGPRGQQFRCQDPDLPCSYLELKELAASGDPIPAELGLTPEELAALVAQLDQTSEFVTGLETIDAACAAGFRVSSTQNANMGIHMTNTAHMVDGVFDPARPEMVLFAKEDGYTLARSEIGDCVDGRWEGAEGFVPVGAVFQLGLTPEHPDGFAGALDNFHVHYNTCAGAEIESGGGRLLGDPEPCEALGGTYMEIIPVWMMHAYVVPGFESETGVFAMFNNQVWPTTDADVVPEQLGETPGDARLSPINNFAFRAVEVDVDQSVLFSNSDSVPHTVTARDGSFDSGVLGSGRVFRHSFAEAGAYEIYCVLHPQMVATVTVAG